VKRERGRQKNEAEKRREERIGITTMIIIHGRKQTNNNWNESTVKLEIRRETSNEGETKRTKLRKKYVHDSTRQLSTLQASLKNR
jgi:hypothetical protein